MIWPLIKWNAEEEDLQYKYTSFNFALFSVLSYYCIRLSIMTDNDNMVIVFDNIFTINIHFEEYAYKLAYLPV